MNGDSNIIDVWMQHPTMKFINHPMFESLRRWMGIEKFEQEIPVEYTLETMDRAGVQTGLICAWWGPQGALISNDEVKEIVNHHPDRFRGIASVDISRPMEGIRELNRCAKELGFIGLRIVQWYWNLPPTHRYYYPIFAECVKLGIPVCLQVGHTGPMCPSEPGRPIPYIDEAALDFPELKIVCGHIGYPWTQEMIAVATKHTNVFIETSAYISKRFPAELLDYMKRNGKKKVLFGTNYPMLTAERCLEDLDSLKLDKEVKSLFLHENAKRIFGLQSI
ncbi:MAG: amidohydrolase [Deltaproteobacteria bacterium]|uniref:Amidohydrolase n=1 Tax=Candidatus Zymogenus saltonus TaxID=2844893 RepID=A0A9D8KDN2_9DELT|nr:amidohydrolase [Candidatus Zymogenus saltonus]